MFDCIENMNLKTENGGGVIGDSQSGMGSNGIGGADREQLKNAKTAVLRLINENRDILFGKTSDSLSRELKEAKWAEVAECAHQLGAFPQHRHWDYLKDTTWQNWRKRFVEKREKKEKFEKTGVGTKIIYDEADLLIMEILDNTGRSGSNSNGMNTTYSSPTSSQFRDISEVLEIEFDDKPDQGQEDNTRIYQNNNDLMINEVDDDEVASQQVSQLDGVGEMVSYGENGYGHADEGLSNFSYAVGPNGNSLVSKKDGVQMSHPKIVSTSSLSSRANRAPIGVRKSAFASIRSAPKKRSANFMGNDVAEPDIGKELAELKCKKIRAELDLLEREAYKKDLEILQLERSLGLPSSPFTRKFNVRANNNSNYRMNR